MISMALLCLTMVRADQPTLVLRGGQVFDPVTMTTHALGQLWLHDDRIMGEKPADAAVDASVPVIDTSGCTLLPGLFDLHVHVSVAGGGMGVALDVTPDDNLRSHLCCGVTNVVDLHADENMIFALRERTRGVADMARLHAAGAAFTVPGGHPTQFGMGANTVQSPADVAQRFAALLPQRPDVIKAVLEHGGWSALPKVPTLDATLFAAIATRAHDAQLPLFTHVWSRDEALTAARNGANALAHGVFLGDADEELIAAMQEHEVAYVPTLAVVLGGIRVAEHHSPYDQQLVKDVLDPQLFDIVAKTGGANWAAMGPVGGGERQWLTNLKALADAGIEIGTGTDAGNPLTPHGPSLLYELMLYVEAGLTPGEALRAATLASANILRVSDRFGSLAPGKTADVVIVRGDPSRAIADLWHIETVIKDGKAVNRKVLAARNLLRAAPPRSLVAGKDVPARMDDFDDGNLDGAWGGTWQSMSDAVAGGGKSTMNLVTTDHALALKGALKEGFQWGPFAGASIQWDAKRKTVVDATGYDGWRLRVRGSPRPYSLSVQRAAVKDFNVFATQLTATQDWQELKIPFSKLKQIGYGVTVPWAANDLVGITIEARNRIGGNDPLGDFELAIDWIELYRDEKP